MTRSVLNRTARDKSSDRATVHQQESIHRPAISRPHADALPLHHAVGNQVVNQIIQPKLVVSWPGEKHEQEADQVAAQIMGAPELQTPERAGGFGRVQDPSIHSACFECEQELPQQPMEEGDKRILRTKEASGSTPEVGPDMQARVNTLQSSGGVPLPESIRAHFESLFGYDFSRVRLHSDARSAELTRAFSARAFTIGNDVAFARGEYVPETTVGKELLAHELTHVVQQGLGAPLRTQSMPARIKKGSDNHSSPRLFRAMDARCRETFGLRGRLLFQGVLEHVAIQQDYQSNVNPSSAIEFLIPEGGGTGGEGYADIVDLRDHSIYEIKPYEGRDGALMEAKKYVDGAQKNCDPNATWRLGKSYPIRVIPFSATTEIVARQYLPEYPGVIIYWVRKRRRGKEKEGRVEDQPGLSESEESEQPEEGLAGESDRPPILPPPFIREPPRPPSPPTKPPPPRLRKPPGWRNPPKRIILRPGARKPPRRTPGRGAVIYQLAVITIAMGLGARPALATESGATSPEEAIIEALQQEGIPVDPEVEEIIRANPELVEKLKDAARRGKLSDAERRAAEDLNRFLKANANDPETIRRLLELTESVKNRPSLALTREEMERTLEANRQNKSAAINGTKGPDKQPPAKLSRPTELPADLQGRWAQTPDHIKGLYRSLSSRSGAGTFDPGLLTQFLDLIGQYHLTSEQVADLQLDPDATPEEALAALKAALNELQGQRPSAAPLDPTGVNEQVPSQPLHGGGTPKKEAVSTPTSEEQERQRKAVVNKLRKFSELAVGEFLMAPQDQLLAELPLKEGQSREVFVVQRRPLDKRLAGCFATIQVLKKPGGGAWLVQVEPGALVFTEDGVFQGSFPITDPFQVKEL